MAKYRIQNRIDSLEEDSWLRIGDLNDIWINNPLTHRNQFNIENPGLLEVTLMKNPHYLSFAAKSLLDLDMIPDGVAIMEELWKRPFPMYIASRGYGKTHMFAVLALLKLALIPGMKIVGVGAGLRQSKMIFDYMVKIWNNSPVLRSIADQNSGPKSAVDRCVFNLNDSQATFIPVGDGKKIRGLRAHTILVDEFSSFPPDVFETVISGFASVSSDPIKNVKEVFRKKARQKSGKWTDKEEIDFKGKTNNQIIITGTADYDFMHFAEYWRRYWVYINSKGDPNKVVTLPNGDTKTLKDYFKDDEMPSSFDYRDYSIIRMPYELIPEGFMDDKVIARAKGSSINISVYQKEYCCVFPQDSDGFFKRSLIEGCVANDNSVKKPWWPKYCPSPFDPILRGNQNKKYVIGIDPAASQDNFAVVVLEMWPEHNRIAYVWSTNLEDFNKRKAKGMTPETDYYSFCSRKIRYLSMVFPTDDIVIDGQGGGVAIIEALHDQNKLESGEEIFWPTNRIMNPEKELPTDYYAGKHNIHVFQFSNYENVQEANHGTRKDLEDKVLLFPRFDAVTLELASYSDAELAKSLKTDKLYDTLEDCISEIDLLKDEMTTIVMSRTSTGTGGRDRWDTPDSVTQEGKKTKMRKDRYSALVMANFIARKIQRAPAPIEFNVMGGFAHQMSGKANGPAMLNANDGPSWLNAVQAVRR